MHVFDCLEDHLVWNIPLTPNHSQLSGNHPLHVFDCLMDHPVSSLLRLRTIPSTLQLDQLSSLSRDHFVVMFLSHQTV